MMRRYKATTRSKFKHTRRWFRYVRRCMQLHIERMPPRLLQLGAGDQSGRGIGIEFDESCFTQKKKYGVGAAVGYRADRWVFGMIERSDQSLHRQQRIRLFLVPNRRRVTLVPIIERHSHPSARLYSDYYSSYLTLSLRGWNHRMVNHSAEFIHESDPEVHTETIEGVWRHAKYFVNRDSGCRTVHLQEKLDEYCWHYMFYRVGNGEKFWRTLKLLVRFGREAKTWVDAQYGAL